jgi:hypothetical protein
VALAAPWLAVLGVLAALVARVKVEILRETEEEDGQPADGADRPGRDADPSI